MRLLPSREGHKYNVSDVDLLTAHIRVIVKRVKSHLQRQMVHDKNGVGTKTTHVTRHSFNVFHKTKRLLHPSKPIHALTRDTDIIIVIHGFTRPKVKQNKF